jgi:hypothetical protein
MDKKEEKEMISRLLIILVSAIFTSVPSFAYASGIGDNIKPLGNLKVSVTVVDNIIFDKDYEGIATIEANVDKMNEAYTKISLGLGDYFNIYTSLGAVTVAELTKELAGIYKHEYKTKSGFLWGGGINAVFPIEEICFIGVDTHYIGWKADVDEVIDGGEKATNVAGKYEHYEIQGTVYLGKRFDIRGKFDYRGGSATVSLMPYIGGMYNYSKIDSDSDITWETTTTSVSTRGEIKNDDKFGAVIGISMTVAESFLFNIEGRFIAENALTVSGSFRF